jgi:hypothetical protein
MKSPICALQVLLQLSTFSITSSSQPFNNITYSSHRLRAFGHPIEHQLSSNIHSSRASNRSTCRSSILRGITCFPRQLEAASTNLPLYNYFTLVEISLLSIPPPASQGLHYRLTPTYSLDISPFLNNDHSSNK